MSVLNDLKITELKFNVVLDVPVKSSILTEGLKVVNSLNDLRDAMWSFKTNEDSTYQDSIDLIIDYETVLNVNSEFLERCFKRCIGSTGAIRRRLVNFYGCFLSLEEILKPQVDAYTPLLEEDFDRAYLLLSEAVGQLSCFLLYQFELNKILKEKGNLESINDAVDFWIREVDSKLETIFTVAEFLTIKVMQCNPNMGVFEKYPELLEPFCDLIGEALYDCLDIDLDTVYGIIEGRIDVDEFIHKIEKRETSDGNI